MIGFTCKYAPVELLAGFGAECRELNAEAENFDYAQGLTHMNMCSHIKALIEEVHRESAEELVLVNCCDSLRRAYDILKPSMKFLFLLDLPHNDNSCARERLADELKRLFTEYRAYSGKEFSFDAFRKAFTRQEVTVTEPHVALLGGRIGEGMLAQLRRELPLPVIDRTCNNNRDMAAPPEGLSLDGLLDWYAGELLGQVPCMRMADISGRRRLLESPNLKGIIYHTVKFCDYYGFEYEMIRQHADVPMIRIETDFTMQSLGQLSTRIGGFAESLGLGKEIKVEGTGQYVAGIDSGSTTTNMAVLDRDGNLVDHCIVRTGAKAQRGAENALNALKIPRSQIAAIVATGYGRKNIDFADSCITEITCHARGAFHLDPRVRTIIDIGGQDSKAISLDEEGNVLNFAMNDKCAAGTGRFLENMARVLETDLEGISKAGLEWKEDLTISSMCTVFAESEVVSLIADNKQISDIVHGLNKSVASKTMNLVGRVKGTGRYMMTGGVARNAGVAECIEELLGEKLIIPEVPDL